MGLEDGYESFRYSEYFRAELPAHWLEKRLGYLAKQERSAFVDGPFGSDLKTSDYQDEGVPLIQLNNIRDSKHIIQSMKFITEEKKQQLIRHLAIPGDVVIAKMADPVARSAIVASDFSEYVIVADCVKMSANLDLVNLNFLVWAINCDYVRINAELVSTGTTRVRINLGELQKLKIPYPPYNEQQKIANFLDHETAKIDTLIEKQQQLIKLLQEKRQAVISHAVTKGLNPNAPMRDSGVEWLGEVPEHWVLKPLKYVVNIRSGGTPNKENSDYWEGDIPWASAKDLKKDYLHDTIDHITEFSVSSGAASLVPVGSILVVVRGMILARMFPVSVASVPMAINQDLKAIVPVGSFSGEFLFWLLKGTADESLNRLDEAGHGTKALRMDAWTSMKLPIPPLTEQHEISNYLEKITKRFDLLSARAQQKIDLLQERRTALISAAVTGKIDVRDWPPPVAA